MSIRLSHREYRSLCYALETITDPIYVFGSRTDLNKRGGDIDIVILDDSPPSEIRDKILMIQRKFVSHTDQKLDIVILPHHRTAEQELFFNSLTKVAR